MTACFQESDSQILYLLLLFQVGVYGLFVAFCVLTLFHLVYSHRGVDKRWGALHATHAMLFLTFFNRFLKLLYAICALKTGTVSFAICWSLSYWYEASALGLFMVHWDIILVQMQQGIRSGLSKYRYFFLFSSIGIVCTIASLISLLYYDPLTQFHEWITMASDFAGLVMGLTFFRIAFLLHHSLTSVISSVSLNSQSRAVPLLSLNSVSAPIQNVNQVLLQMWFAGRVITTCYVVAAIIPWVYYFNPTFKTDNQLQLGLRPVLFNLCLLLAFATVFLVLQSSVTRFVNEGDRSRAAKNSSWNVNVSVNEGGGTVASNLTGSMEISSANLRRGNAHSFFGSFTGKNFFRGSSSFEA